MPISISYRRGQSIRLDLIQAKEDSVGPHSIREKIRGPGPDPSPRLKAKGSRRQQLPEINAKKITEHDRREKWTQKLTTRALASARSCTRTVTGGRTS